MNEPLENKLISAITEQTKAITRLAQSNESLAAIIYETYIAETQMEVERPMYLNGKPRG